MMSISRLALLAGLGSAALCFGSVRAQEAEQEVGPEIRILQRATRFLEGLPSFEVKSTQIYDVVQASGSKIQVSAQRRALVRRPDRVYVETEFDDGLVQRVWYDGTRILRYTPSANAYTAIPAPATIDATLDYLELELGVALPLADLLYSDLSHLEGLAQESTYIGQSNVAGVPCDHLAFIGETVDWQLWVQRQGDPLIRRVVIDYKSAAREPQFTAQVHAWRRSPELPDSTFTFQPPADAERIRTIAVRARGRVTNVEIEEKVK
jgi:hypothetical protein